MAGSMKWFVYTTDSGDDFAIFRDESNTEGINAGTQDYVTASTAQYALPRNVRARYIRMRSADGLVSRNIVALTTTIYNAILSDFNFVDGPSGKTLVVSEKVGERIRVPQAADTGLTDGDAT